MPTVADLLQVVVEVEAGDSARKVDQVTGSVKGIGAAASGVTPSLGQINAALLGTGVSAQRAQVGAQQLLTALSRDADIRKAAAAFESLGVSTGLARQQATRFVDGTKDLTSAFTLNSTSAGRFLSALIGVNVGLSAVAGVGRELHTVLADLGDTTIRFGRTMAEVAAVSGASKEQLVSLSAIARTGGTDIAVGANEAAKGLSALTKGGVSIEAALGGALRASQLMAKAGGVDLAQAAEISTVALNSFGLSAAQLPHVADLVAAAANVSAIDVNDFRQSLNQAGTVAKQVGVSFSDTSVAIAELGQAGVKGSDAGTSLRTFLLRLTPESKEAEAALRALGIIAADGTSKFFDASGQVKRFSEIQQILKTSLVGLTDQQRLATLQLIFGTDAIRAASVFADQGATGFDRLATSMSKIGADEVARKRLDSLGGDMDKLTAQAERLKIALGGVLLGGRPGVQSATGTASAAGNVAEDFGFAGFAQLILANADPFGGGVAASKIFDQLAEQARLRRESIEAAANLQKQVVEPGVALETSIGPTGASIERAAAQTNKLLLPARELRVELDALSKTTVTAAQALNTLEAATSNLQFGSAADVEAVAALRSEGALRQREAAEGARRQSELFRQRLQTQAADTGATGEQRAQAQERLDFLDRELAAQRDLVQMERQRGQVNTVLQREQAIQQQANLGFELSQLPAQDQLLQLRIQGLQIDQEQAPLRAQILDLERQMAQVVDKRLGLEREATILRERQRSGPARAGLEDNQARIQELQLSLRAREPGTDRGTARREIRDLIRAQPQLELDVFRSDQTIRRTQREQEGTNIDESLRRNALEQQSVVLQNQLDPLVRRRDLIDEAAAATQRMMDIERSQFDLSQSAGKERILQAQAIISLMDMQIERQKLLIGNIGALGGRAGPVAQDVQLNVYINGQQVAVEGAGADQSVRDWAASLRDYLRNRGLPITTPGLPGAN